MKALDTYWNNKSVVRSFNEKPPSQDFISYIETNYSDKKNINILDLGCGGGRHTLWLAKSGFNHIYACDLHKEMVDKTNSAAKSYDANINVHQANAKSLPYQNNMFDLVVSTGVLHNLENVDDLSQSFNEVSRVLKDDASFYLTIFTDHYISSELEQQNSKGLYKTVDDIHMLLLSENEIFETSQKSSLNCDQILRSYVTNVETGKRSVLTASFRKSLHS